MKNLSTLPKEEYEALILSCDLFLTENKISVSLGKAVCGGVPGVVLQNSRTAAEVTADGDPTMVDVVGRMEKALPGAVYPYEVFPIWGRRDLEKLCVFDGSSYPDGVVGVEIFGGEPSKTALIELLTDPATRDALRARQRVYADKVAELPEVEEVIAEVVSRR